jgi:hypothetical protein
VPTQRIGQRLPRSLLAACTPLLLLGGWTLTAQAADGGIAADAPHGLSVTVYRAPQRESGSIELDDLEGFALITETRTVHLPAGVTRLRFEGVADGIEPESAIISGLPDGVIEKNRDARILSPAALFEAAVGKPVELRRTNPKTGKMERLMGTVLADAAGVVFESDQGIEALRCSGLPETFSFEPPADLSAKPTLSVLVKSETALTREVTLSYLATGFDWAATYSATLSPDETSMALGAWVTLANSNGSGFPQANTQVVAGRLNRESGEVQPMAMGRDPIAQCWPRGSTSDQPPGMMLFNRDRQFKKSVMAPAAAMARMDDSLQEVVVTGSRVQQEQLGDLKLYRVPDRTTVAARQLKQVRLMDRERIPVSSVYGFEVSSDDDAEDPQPAHRLLRTQNTLANHLGLPLPSGSVDVYAQRDSGALLQHESKLKDLAIDQEVEIDMGSVPDVEVQVQDASIWADSAHAKWVPWLPGIKLRSVNQAIWLMVTISNALPHRIDFELQQYLDAGATVVRADHAISRKNGRPMFRLKVPAQGSITVHYQLAETEDQAVRSP